MFLINGEITNADFGENNLVTLRIKNGTNEYSVTLDEGEMVKYKGEEYILRILVTNLHHKGE